MFFLVVLFVPFGTFRIGDASTLLALVALGGLLFLFMDFIVMAEKHTRLKEKYGDRYSVLLLAKMENEGKRLSITILFEVERALENEVPKD